MKNLEQNIIKWAEDRHLLPASNPPIISRFAQFSKTIEECAELGIAITTGNEDDAKDAIGDIIVTLILQANTWDLDIHECVESAYQEIKNRKGKLVGGMFVKELE